MLKYTLALALALFLLSSISVQAKEFGGIKLEYMNAQNTNFYGFGLFTSDKRFDAEIEFFIAQRAFEGTDKVDPATGATTSAITSEYRLFYASFSGYFHFIRTDKMSFYIGTGIMPLLLRSYAFHGSLGADYFWTENFRAFYTFRYIATGGSDYSFPTGPSFAAGLKWTFDFL